MTLFVNYFNRKMSPVFCHVSRCCSQVSKAKGEAVSTVDESEVSFHSKLATDWWDENGTLKALHALNKIRIEFLRCGLINSGLLKESETHNNPLYLKGLSIADVGCGGGIFSLNMARLGCDVVGLEPSQELVNVAKETVEKFKPPGKTEFIATSVEQYAKDKLESIDAVVCSEVIEHVTQKDEFIAACVKIIKPGGSIFFTTPNRTMIGKLLTIYGAEYLLRLLPVGTHHHEKFITPDELTEMLKKYHCDTRMINGYIYSPPNNTFYWTPFTSVLYALHAVKLK